MKPRIRGLYESLVTEALEVEFEAFGDGLVAEKSALALAEAPDRLALHLGRVIERTIRALPEATRLKVGTKIARALVERLSAESDRAELVAERPREPASVLRAVTGRLPDGRTDTIRSPLIPLLDTVLLTNSPGEPRVGTQVLAEINSADRIDVVMAFIRRTGIAPLLDALRSHVDAGRPLRVLTTTYTGSTEARALDELQRLGADVRVSYDTSGTRLHAKAWLFHRKSGFSTAYIGSSNLTHSAQVSGLEWNVRASAARNPTLVEKVAAVFESYFESGDFVPYDPDEFAARVQEARPERVMLLSPIEIRLEPFQERLVEQIAVARTLGHHRNLLVSATGTGKTVMAAVDYARLREVLPRARLLFVAHREEILEQSLATFRHALRDHEFGELWVGGKRPSRFEYVFASIQSLAASRFEHLAPNHFDVVIVDEFHHAAAASYRSLLDHVTPRELLGLTATPERADGLSVLDFFDGRIAAELSLWDAIDQHRLVPFAYYGVHDGLDLRQVPWRRGRGYDVEGLTNLYTANDAWARFVVKELLRRVDDVRTMRALGFCVSIEHAQFMARVFQAAGIPAVAVWSDTSDVERESALKDLAQRRTNIVFSVDLFNEGIDVPAVDTLLMLRPTDSPTLFLQQLGRGLRRSVGKASCTILDFVGHHRSEFRFDRRFGALLGGSRRDLEMQIQEGFPFLPAGCHMELDSIASAIVLDRLKNAIPTRWAAKVDELRALARRGFDGSLVAYLVETGLELEDVYSGNKSWSDLCEDAGLSVRPAGPNESDLRRACGRLLHLDDLIRLDTYEHLLRSDSPPDLDELSERERRLLRMLVAQLVVDKSTTKRAAARRLTKDSSFADGVAFVWEHPQVLAELRALIDVLRSRITHLPSPIAIHPAVPLAIHARYTRIEILAAFDVGAAARIAPWQTGVYTVRGADAMLAAITLDKSSGRFSPTTRYRDYAVSRELLHWETQSVVREASDTGVRYRDHTKLGLSMYFFARLRADDRAFYFLGPANYVTHEGELPMAITWRLHAPLPGDLFATMAAAVA